MIREPEALPDLRRARGEAVRAVLREAYDDGQEGRWLVRWRLFFLACAELFAFCAGDEWGVTHALLRKPGG